MNHSDYLQLSVFDQVCRDQCVGYEECGGGDGAPCGCPILDPMRRKVCEKCPIACRERDGDESSFLSHYREGIPLESLLPNGSAPMFPVLPHFLPLRTRSIEPGARLGVVGVDLADLSTRRRKRDFKFSGNARSPSVLRQRLRARPSAVLVGILNGFDDILESLWRVPPSAIIDGLRRAGVQAVTGPTFSVYTDWRERPLSHGLIMLRRHNRMCNELAAAGIPVAPNLYWLNEHYRQRLKRWIAHTSLTTVSRDFSMTSHPSQFEPLWRGFLDVLAAARGPLQVVLVGIGMSRAQQALRDICHLGHSPVLATSDPVMRALKGRGRLQLSDVRVIEHAPSIGCLKRAAYDNVLAAQAILSSLCISYRRKDSAEVAVRKAV